MERTFCSRGPERAAPRSRAQPDALTSPLAHGALRVTRPASSLLHGTAAEGARGPPPRPGGGRPGQRVGPDFPAAGQVGSRRCHLVASRSAAPRGPRGLGKPSPNPAPAALPPPARPSARWRALPAPGPGTHAHSHPPAFHSPQQPLTSPGSVSSSRGSSVPGSPSSIVVSTSGHQHPQAGTRGWGGDTLGRFTQSLPDDGPARAGRQREAKNPEKVPHTHLLLVWSCLVVPKVLGEGLSFFKVTL